MAIILIMIKKSKIIFGILLGISLITFSFTIKKNLDCSRVKEGSFYYYSKLSRDKVDIERFQNLQLETNTKTGHVLKSKIVWKTDCSYSMYINALSGSKLSKIDSLISTIPASVDIIELVNKHYIAKTKLTIMSKVIESTDTIYFKRKT
jgi:hypothetical protein